MKSSKSNNFGQREEKILSLLAMEKIMKRAGAYRVSDEAKAVLRDFLEERGERISKRADELSRRAGRCTIRAVDVRSALEED